MPDTETNWATGEAELWLDNDEHAYHEARRITKAGFSIEMDLKALLASILPPDAGLVEQFDMIDWSHVIARIEEDIEEGYE